MLTYNTRSTKFINIEYRDQGFIPQDLWAGIVADKDNIMKLAFDVNSESKIITRTRRKFWDDVSLRGGQYSALMLLLTAIYTLFQGPFQDMKYGLKFAQMRAMDGLSS